MKTAARVEGVLLALGGWRRFGVRGLGNGKLTPTASGVNKQRSKTESGTGAAQQNLDSAASMMAVHDCRKDGGGSGGLRSSDCSRRTAGKRETKRGLTRSGAMQLPPTSRMDFHDMRQRPFRHCAALPFTRPRSEAPSGRPLIL